MSFKDLIKEAWGDSPNWFNNPERSWNKIDSSTFTDIEKHQQGGHWDKKIQRFATNLGLGNSVQHGSHLWQSLAKIAAARIYGERYGSVQLPEMQVVWNAINKPDPSDPNQTIASKHGISNPLSVPEVVPDADMKKGWKYSPQVQKFDAQIRNQNKLGKQIDTYHKVRSAMAQYQTQPKPQDSQDPQQSGSKVPMDQFQQSNAPQQPQQPQQQGNVPQSGNPQGNIPQSGNPQGNVPQNIAGRKAARKSLRDLINKLDRENQKDAANFLKNMYRNHA